MMVTELAWSAYITVTRVYMGTCNLPTVFSLPCVDRLISAPGFRLTIHGSRAIIPLKATVISHKMVKDK